MYVIRNDEGKIISVSSWPVAPDQEFIEDAKVWKDPRIDAKEKLNQDLEKLSLDLGGGRIIQTRPQDQQNIEGKIRLMGLGGSDMFVMQDNKPHPVTVNELQQAIDQGTQAAGLLWDDYMAVLDN